MIIGFCGYKGSGKTLACSYLKDLGFKPHNFKDALVEEMKDNLSDTLLILSEHYSMSVDDLFKNKPPAMRALMQNYGTEVRRQDDPDYWVNKWKDNVDEGDLCVDDVRFLNEYVALKDKGGVLIHLIVEDEASVSSHQSEVEHLSFDPDFTIVLPRGAKEQLYNQLIGILHHMSDAKRQD